MCRVHAGCLRRAFFPFSVPVYSLHLFIISFSFFFRFFNSSLFCSFAELLRYYFIVCLCVQIAC